MPKVLRNMALSGLSVVALVGLLHMPALRPLLQSMAGCPFPTASRTLSAGEAEALRVRTFAPRDAQHLAPRMPALGFALGKDDRQTIAGWARAHGVTCEPDAHGASLRCDDVKARDLGADSSAHGLLGLGFDARGTLVSVQFALHEPDRARALALTSQAERELALAGVPTTLRAGDLRGALSQRHTLVAARDFRGEVMATHVGRSFLVSRTYQRFVP